MKNLIKILTLTVMVGVFANCKKAETGPQGPAGPAGSNGVANIQSSTVTTTNGSWTFDSADNSYSAVINYAAITQSVLDKGVVMLYLGDGTGTEWGAMPFSYKDVEFTYSVKLGQVIVFVNLAGSGTPNNPGGQQFKLVVIPPAMIKPNVNIKNYTEVKTVYGIE